MSKVAIARTNNLSHAEWLKLRKCGIGGSDAAAVCGMNRWRGPLDVYLDKTTDSAATEDNESMYWGRVMEPVLRAEFSKRSGLQTDIVPYMFSCREYPFMIANIDGIVREQDGSTSLLEIKTANGFAASDWDNGLPPEYYIQVQHYLAVVDLKKAYVAVLIVGNRFKCFPIDRDEETIRTIIAMESTFWQEHILSKTPPKVDATSSAALDAMYPTSNKTSVILPEEADLLISNLQEIKNLEEQLKLSKVEAENELKSMMKEAECAKTPSGYSIRWKSSTSSRLDTTRLKSEAPDLVAKYTKVSNYRRFTITAPKPSKGEK